MVILNRSVALINLRSFQLCETVSVKVLVRALKRASIDSDKCQYIYTHNPLDINYLLSLELGLDLTTPRLLSEKNFRKQGGPF